jgi:EAL domain-containing protein (putative c-di-GMP-specific phosphodiesterase class I)
VDEPKLILRPHGGDGDHDRYILVDRAPFSIGRRPDNDCQLGRPDISGQHAKFEYEGGAWLVIDNNTTNGTFVNGRRLEPYSGVPLALGDILYFATKGYQIVSEVDESGPKSLLRTTVLGNANQVRSMMQLIKAINEQRTFPYFQPIIDLDFNEPVGWEALGRACGEDGVMSPAALFHLAEQQNLESKLSRRMRESAIHCGRCHRCWTGVDGAMLFVNLHPSEIDSAHFQSSLEDLAEADFRRHFRVVVEIPESWISKTDDIRRITQQIRSLGMMVAYDDFGVGQSRLTDLREVPPDFVKLDRELIAQAARDKVQYDLVRAIVDACRKMQVRTLGEGIETEEELQACKEMRINLGQGFYFGKPMPAYELFHMPTAELPPACPFVKLNLLDMGATAERPALALPSGA